MSIPNERKNLRVYHAVDDTRGLVRRSLQFVEGRALDLGAGSAKYKPIIQEKCPVYTAADLHAGKNIDVVTDILTTPFQDSSFDAVYCLQVFEHIPKPWLAVQEIRRVLVPGGVCVVSAPFLQASHADPDDYFRYTVAGLESLFSAPEFELLESGTYNRLYSILFDFVRMLSFNVYEKQKPFTWRIVQILIRTANALDRLCSNKIIYMNSYVIARKCQ